MEKFVITIGRQYGSGGREVGKKLAEKLGVKYYDKELIALSAENTGLEKEYIEEYDEKPVSKISSMFAYGANTTGYYMPVYNVPIINDRLFYAQMDVIRGLAEKEACVIVGRCADYILRDIPNVFSVFLHANLADRIKRLTEEYQVESKNIERYIAKYDKKRSMYYYNYTDKEWGKCDSYDMSFNTSKFSVDQIVEMIISVLKVKGSKPAKKE
ncbi:MAG: cytidylate kinase-like family protein [Clostridia bacterium]